MDNSGIDSVTKEILAGSKLEITNPGFDEIVIKKIRSVQRRRTLFHNLGISFLVFLASDGLIFCILKILRINIVGLGSEVSLFIQGVSSNIHNGFSNVGSLIFPYFLILVIVIFVLNKALDLQYSDDFTDM